VGKLNEQADFNYGYDAQKDKYCDMVKSGIIDPVKVVRCALQDAASIAGLLLTTEATIAELPKKDEQGAHGGHGGGMGGMGDMM
jgi:chaperonin GroEL